MNDHRIVRKDDIAILYSKEGKELLEISSSYTDEQIEEIFLIANDFYFEGYMTGQLEKTIIFKDFFDEQFSKFGEETVKYVSRRKR